MPTVAEKGYAHPEMLVDTAWLAEHLNDPDLVLIDCESWDAYHRAHIPRARCLASAIKVPTKREPYLLKDPADGVFIMKPEMIAEVMGHLGIGDHTIIYAYDGHGCHYAARLWWVLRHYGHPNVRLVDGGWGKWLKEGRLASRQTEAAPAQAAFTPRPQPQCTVTAEELRNSQAKPGLVILDARTEDEYVGKNDRGTKRGGHVPGAVHQEWVHVLTPDEEQTFRPAAELLEMYRQVGVTPDKEVLTYCHGNIRSSHTAFTLALLGFDRVRNYEGAWAEWGNRLDLPIS